MEHFTENFFLKNGNGIDLPRHSILNAPLYFFDNVEHVYENKLIVALISNTFKSFLK